MIYAMLAIMPGAYRPAFGQAFAPTGAPTVAAVDATEPQAEPPLADSHPAQRFVFPTTDAQRSHATGVLQMLRSLASSTGAAPVHPAVTTSSIHSDYAPCDPSTPARRCVFVISTWTKTTGAFSTAGMYQALDALRDMRIRVTLVVLDAIVHKAKFDSYKAISNTNAFPQIFVEDVLDGANCVFVPPSDLQAMMQWIGSDSQPLLNDECLDKYSVPMQHRAAHVFKGVAKHAIGIYHPEKMKMAAMKMAEQTTTPATKKETEKNTTQRLTTPRVGVWKEQKTERATPAALSEQKKNTAVIAPDERMEAMREVQRATETMRLDNELVFKKMMAERMAEALQALEEAELMAMEDKAQ